MWLLNKTIIIKIKKISFNFQSKTIKMFFHPTYKNVRVLSPVFLINNSIILFLYEN